jgi:hypothetical protein
VSAFLPNCRVTILDAGAAVDANGDEVADGVPVAEHLPAFWAQKDQRTYDPVSGRRSIIRGYRVRLRPGTVVTEDQRIRRESDGLTAQVNQVDEQATLSVAGDVVVRAIAITR